MSKISAEKLVDILAEDSANAALDLGAGGLQRRSLSEELVMRISRLIQVGNLLPGDQLPVETRLAESLGVSRPVLREALKMLSVMGLTESRRGGAHVITDLKPEKLIRPLHFLTSMEDYDPAVHYQARDVIDCQLIRIACEAATDEDIAKVQLLAEKGAATVNDPIAFRLLDFEFHSALNAAAHNILLLRMSQALYELGLNWRRAATQRPENVARSIAEHTEIAAALAARDVDRAEAAQRTHIQSIQATTIEERKKAND